MQTQRPGLLRSSEAELSEASTPSRFRLLVPESTAAVILGAHDWTQAGLSRAPSFLRSAKAFLGYLIDSAGLGLDPALVLDLFDDPAAAGDQLARIRDTLHVALRDRWNEGRPVEDVLVYYIGHGQTDGAGHLSLLVRRSLEHVETETSIKATDLARVLKVAAPQQRRLIILDCCFSEAAAAAFLGMGATDEAVASIALKDLTSDQPRLGTLLLCSSPKSEVSVAPAKATHTLFSGAVVNVLRGGIEARTAEISFADLRDEAYHQMVAAFGANAPRPILHQVNARDGDLTRVPAFPNRASSHAAQDADRAAALLEADEARQAAKMALTEQHKAEGIRAAALQEAEKAREAAKTAVAEQQKAEAIRAAALREAEEARNAVKKAISPRSSLWLRVYNILNGYAVKARARHGRRAYSVSSRNKYLIPRAEIVDRALDSATIIVSGLLLYAFLIAIMAILTPSSEAFKAEVESDREVHIKELGMTLGIASAQVVVLVVTDGSEAARKGLRTGSIILEAGFKKISSPADVKAIYTSAVRSRNGRIPLRVKDGDGTSILSLAVRGN